jgi:hypothetical protein
VVLETRVSADNHEGQAVDAEPVIRTKVSAEVILTNAVAVISPSLFPIAMVGVPMSGRMLLPCAVLDPLFFRIPLVSRVPVLCMLWLVVVLLALLLSMLLMPVILLSLRVLWLLRAVARRFLPIGLLCVRRLLVCRLCLPLLLSVLLLRLCVVVSVFLLLGMILLFALLIVLSGQRNCSREEQRQNSRAGDSNRFHRWSSVIPENSCAPLAHASRGCVDRVANSFA